MAAANSTPGISIETTPQEPRAELWSKLPEELKEIVIEKYCTRFKSLRERSHHLVFEQRILPMMLVSQRAYKIAKKAYYSTPVVLQVSDSLKTKEDPVGGWCLKYPPINMCAYTRQLTVILTGREQFDKFLRQSRTWQDGFINLESVKLIVNPQGFQGPICIRGEFGSLSEPDLARRLDLRHVPRSNRYHLPGKSAVVVVEKDLCGQWSSDGSTESTETACKYGCSEYVGRMVCCMLGITASESHCRGVE